jgi:dTDP-4-dehydrorhamnose reductase
MTATCLILGGGGQMGTACAAALTASNMNVVALSRSQCDIADMSALDQAFKAHRPDLVINTAAFTAVDACETDKARADQINATAPGHIAQLCAQTGAALIHLSTDYVYGDAGTPPLGEATAPSPLNYYGQSKLAGEEAIRAVLDRHVILRTSWVFSEGSNNFFKTIMTLSDRLPEIKIVSDEASCPTFAPDLADAIAKIAERLIGPAPIYGTWHACGSEGVTRLAFASAIMQARLRAGGKVARLLPITQGEFGAAARRPVDSRMSCAALKRDFAIAIPSFQNQLDANVAAMLLAAKEK